MKIVAARTIFIRSRSCRADATLVLLAEGLGANDVLTLDGRGFSTFRTRKGRALRLVLDG